MSQFNGFSLRILAIFMIALTTVGCQQDLLNRPTPLEPSQQLEGNDDSESYAVASAVNESHTDTGLSGSIALFDGKSLDGWVVTNFGGEGDCVIENGNLVVEAGSTLSGVTTKHDNLPKTNYEIALEAKKTDGDDFFCGLTFPVDDSHCTFIVGGWGGCLAGLSCIDERDASSNETRKIMNFKRNRWYKIKVRVKPERIQAWIDDVLMVDQNLAGHTVSLRNETRPSRPLGLSNFQTTSEFRNVVLTRINPKAN